MKKPNWSSRLESPPTSSWPRSPATSRSPMVLWWLSMTRFKRSSIPCLWNGCGVSAVKAARCFSGWGFVPWASFDSGRWNRLTSHFGSHGEHLWQLAHGIDDRSVVPEREAKSISHETTFEQDIDDQEVLRGWLLDLTEQVAWRLRRHELRGRVVHLKVRFADFSLITRSQTLPEPTDITRDLWQVADEMLCHRLPADHLPVRLLGMGVSGFDASGVRQLPLFDQEERQRQTDLDATTDQIRERFGFFALYRATSLPQQRKSADNP